MKQRKFNFGPGPSTLPLEVMEQIREEFLDFQGMGASIIEISHRSVEFRKVLASAKETFARLVNLPKKNHILFVHGGARMQFSAVPMNLMARKPRRLACYAESGVFSQLAALEARRYGQVEIVASSEEDSFRKVPKIPKSGINSEASYFHMTSNNTIYGTRWQEIPQVDVPVVVDATSDLLSRSLDYERIGMIYGGLQKNLGPSGLALVIIRDDLLHTAIPETPNLLNYTQCVEDDSLTNTTNTFAIYVMDLVLKWVEKEGGLKKIEKRNEEKAELLYQLLDDSDFYQAVAHREHRSAMNVTFRIHSQELEKKFLEEAENHDMIGLKGHRLVGGIRASLYNAMSLDGVKTLRDFMKDFEQQFG